jgi:hypothetical protein
MAMLARKLGHAQLTEAVRFRSAWEGTASLGIRAGDVSSLGIYDANGRLHGGSYEEMTERACRAYLAEYLAGTDVVLTAYERRECADLSRRIRGYLLDWGQLQPGKTADLREGARAYAGDLIIARQNDNQLEAGQQGRALANGDLLRVDAVGQNDMTVSRLIRPGHAAAERTWSAPFTITRSYAQGYCDLGYAQTWHTVEGQTVEVGIAVANDKATREGLYVAMSRGAQRNEVYAYPSAQEPANSVIGQPPAPDPELARQRELQADRETAGPTATIDEQDPVTILAPVVRRDNAELSATETRERAESDTDHLSTLHAIWMDHCRAEAYGRYAQAVRDHAEPADAGQILRDTDRLWRTVRSAELAGLDGADVIRAAITGRPFTGARSHSAVLDARIREMTGDLPARIRDSWTASLPRFADPELDRYVSEVAAAMDDRQRRIGEHTAREAPLWAAQALGQVPKSAEARADWADKAGRLGAYREMFGWDHPGEAIGPEPPAHSPKPARNGMRFAAMARVEGIDVRHLTDGQLLARRRAYEAETSWAPKHVAGELRAARRQEQFSNIEATRHGHEAAAAARRAKAETAALHEKAAGSWAALGQRATLVRDQLTEAHDTWCQWEAVTEPTRRLAWAADVELKRRGVLGHDDHLRSAEPEGFVHRGRERVGEMWVQPRLDGSIELPDEPEPLGSAEREERALEVLGLTLGYDQPELPVQISQVAEYNRERQAEIDERRSMRIPAEEPDEMDIGEAWSVLAERRRDAVIQPPKPPIPAADAITDREPEPEREAEA